MTNIDEPCVSILLSTAKLLIPKKRLQDIQLAAYAKKAIGKWFESATKGRELFNCSIVHRVDLNDEITRRFIASVLDGGRLAISAEILPQDKRSASERRADVARAPRGKPQLIAEIIRIEHPPVADKNGIGRGLGFIEYYIANPALELGIEEPAFFTDFWFADLFAGLSLSAESRFKDEFHSLLQPCNKKANQALNTDAPKDGAPVS